MNKKFVIRVVGAVFIIAAVTLAGFVTYLNSEKDDKPLIFADRTMLSALWDDYKQEYWERETGRTLDKERNSITTSEGQSYTMLRAVWQSDKATFDKTWEWTKDHIQREDELFSWKWGEKSDGTYGVLTDEGGQNTASDADVDIAFALMMAAGRWQQQEYADEAKKLIPAIWEKEVVTIQGKPYLASNDLEKNSSTDDVVMNPSYFAPYAYREFAKIDQRHDWNSLVDSSYELIDKSSQEPLDKQESAYLTPDWFLMNKQTGALRATNNSDLTTNYSYDAIRTPWRLALDYQWHNDERAKEILSKMTTVQDQWKKENVIYSTYTHDGEVVREEESPATYGANLGLFYVIDRDAAKEIYEQKLKTLYDPNTNSWAQDVSYYSDNWAWFGMALYNEVLDNPSSDITINKDRNRQ